MRTSTRSTMRRLGTLILLALAILPPTPEVRAQRAAQGARSADWSPVSCGEFKIETRPDSRVECGFVSVPLKHAEPNGAKIRLATVILPAPGANRQPDPL